ncbi:hypothetical protein DFH07DRAFT_922912 [Mycena maculata]|uniref:Uncharacterized protein n=1 Tax=Mycena maculata TaxID=230809 RepID=A0AAD7IUQ2_9AGAR|nr:hypothetical protein DFH07DRAFT_922912 [Mycena maculata]
MGVSLSTRYVSSWQDSCAATFNCTSEGLVNKLGEAINPTCPANGSIPPEVWGITARACQEYCGMEVLVQSVDFSSSATTIATWTLPWMALIAQLPFEAVGWMDLLSGFLCVGSPALAAYSLALTAFNRRSISTKFRRLKTRAEQETPGHPYMAERIESASFILQEAQQGPIRADQRTGELGRLIAVDDERIHHFWRTAAKDLKNTRRDFTYSFLAQVLLAFLSYLISFIAAVHDSLGNPDVGLQFASSTVWSWMLPIVFGYISVGSQYKAGCIKDALTNMSIPDRDTAGKGQRFPHQKGLRPNADLYSPLIPPAIPPGTSRTDIHDADGIPLEERWEVHNHASTSQLRLRAPSVGGDSTHPVAQPLPPPTWWGFDVRGDERREGPIFNYARIFTSFTCAEHVEGGFAAAIGSFQNGNIPNKTEEIAKCCGFQQRENLIAYTAWAGIPPLAIQHMVRAALIALFLQWGTTGAAILVAYNTPAVCLGCRSGSYLIYGIAATASWVLLVLSHILSHAFMQRHEHNPDRHGGVLAALAVITRGAGKVIAISNALWLVVSSFMENMGMFETCWCQTCAVQLGADGWTPVFKAAIDLRAVAGGVWIGGFTMSMLVSLFVAGFFAYHR